MMIGSAPMDPLLKENRQMLEAELKLSYESAEGIQALKEYAEEESPALHDALIGTSEALNKIEENRKAMVNRIRVGFVRPFEKLVDEWKVVEIQKRELEQAKKLVEKAEKSLNKINAKSEDKRKDGEVEAAEENLQAANENLNQKSKIRKKKYKAFHSQKISVIKKSLRALITERKIFHEESLSVLDDVKVTLKIINVKKEGKLFAPPEIRRGVGKRAMVRTGTGVAVGNGSEQENPSKKENSDYESGPTSNSIGDFKSKLTAIAERVIHTDLGLAKVIRENRQILAAHQRLSKETREGVEAYKKYGKKESPDIGDMITKFAESLEIIEVNRQAFIEQMKFEFLQPLEKLMAEWKNLQQVIKEDKKTQEILTKTKRRLDRLKEKPDDKLEQGELDEAESIVEDATVHRAESAKKVSDHTLFFGELKAKTLTAGLGSLLERNLKFHDQALNIIGNAEKLVKKY
ncbi:MAG: hypothetical protein ACTSYU_00930 [Promethearchaeota archaeon]